VAAGFLLGLARVSARAIVGLFRDGYGFILMIVALLISRLGFWRPGQSARMTPLAFVVRQRRCSDGCCCGADLRAVYGGSRYLIYIGTLIGAAGGTATSLNLVVGYAGQFRDVA